MRVRITHSIELERIPKKIMGFLQEVSSKSAGVVHDVDDIALCMEGDFSIESALKRIDKVRRELSIIDHIMSDCSDILHGYQKTMVQLREPQLPIEENHDDETGDEEVKEG